MNSDHACAAPVAGPADPTEDNLLLASKFAVPEPPPFVVTRPQLAARLTGAVRQPVTVVTGPAGSGKTQLVASWVATRPVPERAEVFGK